MKLQLVAWMSKRIPTGYAIGDYTNYRYLVQDYEFSGGYGVMASRAAPGWQPLYALTEPDALPAVPKALEDIDAALREALAEGRAFVLCVEGRNGAVLTLHNCESSAIAAQMLPMSSTCKKDQAV
jgi:hypothetical protein